MSVKIYNELVNPFLNSKVLAHIDRVEDLLNNNVTIPVTCEIDLADGFCNNKCPHCFFESAQKRDAIFIDKTVILNTIRTLAKAGVKGVEFVGGGEPTTHPEFIEIIKETNKIGIAMGLITNGLLLDRYLDILPLFNFIRISLDAACEATYEKTHGVKSFNKVIENIQRIDESYRKNKVGIGFLILPDNVEDIIVAAELCRKLKVRFIQYRPASIINGQKLDIEKIKNCINCAIMENQRHSAEFQIFDAGVKWQILSHEKRHYKKCRTNCLSVVIKANGDVPICSLKRNDPDSILGNIYKNDFFDFWGSQKHVELIKAIDINACRTPCKYDNYNIFFEAIENDLININFI